MPSVEISQETMTEMQVDVEEVGSQEGGANISFPFTDSAVGTSVRLSDDLVLDELPNTPGGKVLNTVATDGPDGSMVLSAAAEEDTQQLPMVKDSEQIAEVEVLENQFQVIKNSMNGIQNKVNYEMETVIQTLSLLVSLE